MIDYYHQDVNGSDGNNDSDNEFKGRKIHGDAAGLNDIGEDDYFDNDDESDAKEFYDNDEEHDDDDYYDHHDDEFKADMEL